MHTHWREDKWRGLLYLSLIVIFSFSSILAFRIHALEPAQQEKMQQFLRKYPEADANNDGKLTFSEVWEYRSKTSRTKGKEAEEFTAATRLMRETYTPAPIDQNKKYGPASEKKIKLFILSGQSNMVGQGLSGELSEDMWRGNERVLMFEGGKWQPLRPLKITFGPEIAFASEMAKAWPGETIGVVKQARGGTGVLAWHPEWTAEKADLTGDARKGNLWKELTDKVHKACENADCEIMGFIWQQGAKDMSKVETGKMYLVNLGALTEGLRREFGVPDLPLVLGSYRMGDVPDDLSDLDPEKYEAPNRAGGAYVLKAQYDAQKELWPAKMVPIRGLKKHKYNVHLNTSGQLELGRLFAGGYLEVFKEMESQDKIN